MTRYMRTFVGSDGRLRAVPVVSPPSASYRLESVRGWEALSDEEQEGSDAVVLPANVRHLAVSSGPMRRPWLGGPAVQRPRPRLWAGAGAGAGAGTSSSIHCATAAALASGAQHASKHRRRCVEDYYDSDDEDDSSSDEDDTEEEALARGRRYHCRHPRSKRRRRQCPLSPRRRNDGGNDALCRRRCLRGATVVSFAFPLVTEAWTRPRTAPEDRAALFYSKADEMSFRAEYRTEKRLRLLGQWQSSDDESDHDDHDDHAAADSHIVIRPDDDVASFMPETTGRGDDHIPDHVQEVTESSSSNDDDDEEEEEEEEEGGAVECSDDSSSSSSQSDEQDSIEH